MKFTKEQLAEKLKAQLTEKVKTLSISDKTFQTQVETLYSFVGEETELEDFSKQVLPSLVSLDGNYRKYIADFAKHWETEHPATKKEPSAEPQKTPPTGDEKYDNLFKQVEEMRKERENEKMQKAINAKRSELIAKFKSDGVNNDEWLNDYVSCISINENTDVDAQSKIAVKLFNVSQSHQNPNITPNGSGGTADVKEDFSDVISDIKKNREQ